MSRIRDITDFSTMVQILSARSIFFETWKDEMDHIFITTGGNGMDIQIQFDADSGDLQSLHSLVEAK